MKIDKSNAFFVVQFLVLIIMPIVLLCLPNNIFDSGTRLCLYYNMTGKECMTCGMTRAVQRLIHMDIEGAWHYNKLAFLILPLLTYLYVIYIKKLYNKINS